MAIDQTILADEQETAQLGADIAMALRAGDVLALKGELGAGKTTLARGLIRQLADDAALEVPSPTYTLCQPYALDLNVSHFDLYRIADPHELDELGLEEAMERGVAVIEWPERAQGLLPAGTLTVELASGAEGGRVARFSGGSEALRARLSRSLAIRGFLDRCWQRGATRRFLQGDASTRRYETVDAGGEVRVLMDSPRQPDGPAVDSPTGTRKPYSQIAHLAEDVTAFIAIDELLRQRGFAAPAIHGTSISEGLLLCEHLGPEGVLAADGTPVAARYREAARLLARLHEQDWPATLTGTGGEGESWRHDIATYDREAILIEVSLLADWYAPAMTGSDLDVTARTAFFAIWDRLAARVSERPATLVLRDFHSPNLIWRAAHAFPANLGLIDFQDAVLGPAAYDLASLAQDARVDIAPAMERALIDAYLFERRQRPEDFDTETFLGDYAIMAAQRATKVLGIFVRLDRRDGKPGYLKHLPRLRDYLGRSLAHPALAEYRAWCESMPGLALAGR